MEHFDFIDFIILKEGEIGLSELVKSLERDKNFDSIPNLVWRSSRGIVFNQEKYVDNLDDLPTPDFSDFNLDKYYFSEPILSIGLSRNCPWNKCKFCQLNMQHGRYRQRSIDKVINDFKTLIDKDNIKNFFRRS